MLHVLSISWYGRLAGLCLALTVGTSAAAAASAVPPSRVIRLSYLSGTVSFAPAATDDWVDATLNRPLIEGDRLWVENGDRAELHLGSTALRLSGGTGLEILRLDDTDLKLKLTQGSVAVRVREYPDEEDLEIDTPNLGFEVRESGEYRVAVDPDHDATTVTVRRGSGSVFTDDESRRPVRLYDGQRMKFDGKDLFVLENGRAGERDEFERWSAQRDAREDSSRSARYVSREMTGYEDLDEHGEWREVSGYGAVWVPRVTITGWAPYHYGHWAWVVPWGWTWIDDAPWGFAPFHYGRWAYFGSYWGWVPGPLVPRPVYAPALVAFVGGHSGSISWGVSLTTGLPGVAWFALGPGEPYRPDYAHDPHYLERLNPRIPYDRTIRVYANQRVPHAVAVMPERDFVRGVPMRPGHGAVPREQDFSRLSVRGALPVSPLRESRAGTLAPARQLPPEHAFRPAVTGQPAAAAGPGGRRGLPEAGAARPRENGATPNVPGRPERERREAAGGNSGAAAERGEGRRVELPSRERPVVREVPRPQGASPQPDRPRETGPQGGREGEPQGMRGPERGAGRQAESPVRREMQPRQQSESSQSGRPREAEPQGMRQPRERDERRERER